MWSFFVKNSKFTLLLGAGAILFGLLSAVQMPRESQPEVKIPIGVVVTAFPGASVEEVEQLVTNTLEDSLTGLDSVEDVNSVSRRGISSITVEFDADEDVDDMIDNLKDAVDAAKIDLPDQAEDPVVQKISLDDTPFLTYAMSGPFDLAQLGQYADIVKDEIEGVGGVSTVQVFGAREREMQVLVEKNALDQFGLSINQVVRAISSANADVPIGSIVTGGEEYSLRFAGRLTSAEDVATVPIGTVDNVPIFVRDIATVTDGYSEPTKTVFYQSGETVNPAVSIRVFKTSGGDVTRIAENIGLKLAELQETGLPESIEILKSDDLAEVIDEDLSSLFRNGLATVIIVAILLALFLGLREAVMASISIPLSFLMTFIILNTIGLTLNFMTLFSLILSLGILVDSTIVINERLSKGISSGQEPLKAALGAIKELQYPLATGTLTTIFAFLPMLLTGGILGQFIKTIPITVTAVLLSSLFVALAIIPALTIAYAKRGKTQKTMHTSRYGHVFDQSRESYAETLSGLLTSPEKRKRFKVWLLVAGLLTYALPGMSILGVELFPPSNEDIIGVDLEKPFGTALEETTTSITALATELAEDERVDYMVINSGFSGSLGSQAGGGEGSHLAYIQVHLDKERSQSSFEIVDELQEQFKTSALGIVSVTQPGYGPGAAAPVQVTIAGENLSELERISNEIETLVSSVPGTQNVRSSLIDTNGQFVTRVNRARAAQLGVTATDVAITLRTAINGVDATEMTVDGDDVDVVVRYGLTNEAFEQDTVNKRKTNLSTIEGLTIATPGGDVPLLSVAEIGLENSRASVLHQDGERVVTVQANLQSSAAPGMVFGQINDKLADVQLPDGYSVRLGGEDEETQESLGDMFRAMILAGILIAGLMVLQFGSFKDTLIIMATIPLALIGVFPGLLLVGQPLSFPGMIGVVALAGIVVNNAIIFIDKINTCRKEGSSPQQAVIEAGRARLEPIVLTTITTVCGILPLAITEPLWSSLGYAIIFGLLVSTFFTLFVIPMLYLKLHKRK